MVNHPLGTMGSQCSLLAASLVCQSESKAGDQQVLSRIDTLLDAAWEGIALGWGDVGTQWSRAVKWGVLSCTFLPSLPTFFCVVNVDHKTLGWP